jgi:hypothetical protein
MVAFYRSSTNVARVELFDDAMGIRHARLELAVSLAEFLNSCDPGGTWDVTHVTLIEVKPSCQSCRGCSRVLTHWHHADVIFANAVYLQVFLERFAIAALAAPRKSQRKRTNANQQQQERTAVHKLGVRKHHHVSRSQEYQCWEC